MSNVLSRRKPTRLPGFDYRAPGPYLVTVCCQHREHRFGRIFDEAVNPSPAGQMVADIWTSIPDRFPTVVLDLFVVMPNHIHGLLWFEPGATPSHPALGDVIGWFKAVTTNRYIHGVRTAGWPPYDRSLWQRTFHEHIVRNDADMDRIRTYIANNPATWHEDRYHEP